MSPLSSSRVIWPQPRPLGLIVSPGAVSVSIHWRSLLVLWVGPAATPRGIRARHRPHGHRRNTTAAGHAQRSAELIGKGNEVVRVSEANGLLVSSSSYSLPPLSLSLPLGVKVIVVVVSALFELVIDAGNTVGSPVWTW